VIRGATPHFEVVVRESAAGVGALAAEGKIAVAFGVLACENIEQAVERAGAKAGNRGYDAAMVAVEMADLYARMEAEKKADALPVSVVPAPTTDLPRRK
jgi:6,7-dimethyl-8-ribityllumazine synthase